MGGGGWWWLHVAACDTKAAKGLGIVEIIRWDNSRSSSLSWKRDRRMDDAWTGRKRTHNCNDIAMVVNAIVLSFAARCGPAEVGDDASSGSTADAPCTSHPPPPNGALLCDPVYARCAACGLQGQGGDPSL